MSNMIFETKIHDMILERLTPVAQVVAALQENGAGFNEAELTKLIKAELAKVKPAETTIILRDMKGAEKKLTGAHPKAKAALMLLQQPRIDDCNMYIWGEAGSGKTTLAEQIAEAMGLKLYFTGAALTKFDLLGFMLPSDVVIETGFMNAWINGGVFLLDDADRSCPKALAMLNMALANGKCDFSNTGQGMIDRHPECYIIFTGNTPMTGANAKYSAASKVDSATRDRFMFVRVDMDNKHELKITPNQEWTKRVQKVRATVKKLGGNIERIVEVTMRASFLGAPLLKAGMSQADVEESVLFKGAGTDVTKAVYAQAGEPSKEVGELTGY